MRVAVDATAWKDLDDIGRWIARDNPQAARRVLDKILATIEQLAHFPRLARVGRARGTYERVVAGTPYIIVFELWRQPPAIVITAIVHGSRDR
jgi:plasmid stabilization system protein ParE